MAIETRLEMMDFGAQIANLVGLGNGVVAGNGLVDTLGGIAMGAAGMAGFDTIALSTTQHVY